MRERERERERERAGIACKLPARLSLPPSSSNCTPSMGKKDGRRVCCRSGDDPSSKSLPSCRSNNDQIVRRIIYGVRTAWVERQENHLG